MNHDLVLNLNKIVFGIEKDIEISRLKTCGTCDGFGVELGMKPTSCTVCASEGRVAPSVMVLSTLFKPFIAYSICDGTGESSTPYNTYGEDNQVKKTKRICMKVLAKDPLPHATHVEEIVQ